MHPFEDLVVPADGVGIHWPEIDEDLSVAGLLSGSRSSSTAK